MGPIPNTLRPVFPDRHDFDAGGALHPTGPFLWGCKIRWKGDTASTPEQGSTWGSLSIQVGGIQIRQAAAVAKAALLDQAATNPKKRTVVPAGSGSRSCCCVVTIPCLVRRRNAQEGPNLVSI